MTGAVPPARPDAPRPGKRKHCEETSTPAAGPVKRPRNEDPTTATGPPESLSLQPLRSLLADLQPKYEVKHLSVISSTSIAKRVDTILQHLGRFHPWDTSVLPGVVLLYARAGSANKLITIAETVRRRIHEAEQKWYQYNRLYEMEWAAKQSSRSLAAGAGSPGAGPGPTRRRADARTAARPSTNSTQDAEEGEEGQGTPAEAEEEDEEDYFETMTTGAPTPFERAIYGEPRPTMVAHLSVFLSRVPVPELKTRENFTVQSNEDQIERIRKKKAGLI